jgi:hypothetical protein
VSPIFDSTHPCQEAPAAGWGRQKPVSMGTSPRWSSAERLGKRPHASSSALAPIEGPASSPPQRFGAPGTRPRVVIPRGGDDEGRLRLTPAATTASTGFWFGLTRGFCSSSHERSRFYRTFYRAATGAAREGVLP